MTPVMNEAMIEMARKGAMTAGQYSPLNTMLLMLSLGVLGMILKYLTQNRRMTISVNGEIRREFLDEMTVLRDEIKGLREENKGLRDEVRELHGIIDGMRREAQASEISTQRVVAERLPTSAAIDRAMKTLDQVKGPGQ